MAAPLDTSIIPADVQAVFNSFAPQEQKALLNIRTILFDMAAETSGVGAIEETLKWGQPSYLTTKPKSGTTIRLGVPEKGCVAMYVHCSTTVIESFRDVYADIYRTEGKRAVYFDLQEPLPEDAVKTLIHMALTYHL